MSTQQTLRPTSRHPEVANSVAYTGSLLSFLSNSTETDGRFALVYFHAKVGNEPPPHVHLYEHEIYYVLEGELEFFVEDEENSLTARKGGTIFLPQGKAHASYFRSPEVQLLTMVVAAGEEAVGADVIWRAMAQPTQNMELPTEQKSYAMSDSTLAKVMQLAQQHGSVILSPEETKQRLPHYPGFGAHLNQEA